MQDWPQQEMKDSKPFPLLVVDDSPVARKVVEQALPAEQFRILPAKTGMEALDLFALHRPGLVITDWVMPDLSGIELCQRLRGKFNDSFVYVILLTSLSEKSSVVKGLQAGADDYLTKPFDAQELLARVNVGRRFVELHREIEAKNRFLEQLALTDDLTGLPNRRAIEQWARRQISGAVRHGFSFWVIMADVDQFKSVNDTHGHDAGDVVLKKFAEILQANSRQCDICGRLGGDEFLLVITHSNQDGISQAIERLRGQIEAQKFEFGDSDVAITASFGVAGFDRGSHLDFGRLLAQADLALHSAKRRGRNRVETVPAEVH
jgi:two-component system, cell cycle response regulator